MSFLFMSIVVIVAAIGILNTMLMAVYERVKEVGVMAAFGYELSINRGISSRCSY
ncbi:MAG: hypothetical protein HXS48_23065 [Theionarchaea archaeon]|nr:hypothetical protein [Theionarchaea archaeon]